MSWYTSWSYLPINYNTTIGTVENITQQTYFRNNLGGIKAKIKFSNRFGQEPLVLEKVVLAQRTKENKMTEAATVMCKGKTQITIAPGEEFYSDEFDWVVPVGEEIVLSVYIKERTNVQCACSTWCAKSWHTVYKENGDYTDAIIDDGKESREIYPYVEADVNKSNIVVGVSAIKIFTEMDVKTIALFGDSITHMSYYADALSERLYHDYPGTVTVVNRGIGGNRVLHDATFAKDIPGQGACFGTAAVKRFEEDVYGTEAPDYVLMMEGVNDMMHPEFFGILDQSVTAAQLAEGVKGIVETAKRHGSEFYLGTVMPFGNDEMPSCPLGEQVRMEFNQWIREQTLTDGVFDFDAAMQDENRPKYLKDGVHIGDGLHPNTEGGIVMAETVLSGRK